MPAAARHFQCRPLQITDITANAILYSGYTATPYAVAQHDHLTGVGGGPSAAGSWGVRILVAQAVGASAIAECAL